MRSTALNLATLVFVGVVSCACECGYVLHDTGAYFTHVLSSNFSAYPDATSLNTNPATSNLSRDWTVQSWSAGTGPDNPIPRRNDEANVYVQDGTLTMRQIGYTAQDKADNKSVSIAAIVSKEDQILHGSFRTVLKVSEDRGSVGGFFWYHNDSNEIDIEVLTKEVNDTTIHYTTHPSVLPSSSIIPGASNASALSTAWTVFQEHRFDWSKGNVTFYQGGNLAHTTTLHIPQAAGSAQMNLWADGSAWSGDPSTTNVTMNIKSIVIFYNTTASESGTDQTFNRACQAAGGGSKSAVCMDTDLRTERAKGDAALKAVPGFGLLVSLVILSTSLLLA